MIPIAAIRQHVTDASIPGVKRVHGALQLSAAIERGQFDAEAYVIVQQRQAEANQLINAVEHRVVVRVSVVSIVRDSNDSTGERQAESLEARCDAVVAALLGWAPAAGFKPFEYLSGQLVDFDGGAAIWADEFETDYLVRKVQ